MICVMDLVREDGSVIELEEGKRHELGRGSGFAESDGSVSRLHVIVELSRPASRKGKEVVGKSPDLKLHVQVVGRNPICLAIRGGQGSKNLLTVKFAGKGEEDLLAPGDEFSLSIKRPSFFRFRQSSRGGVRTDEAPLSTGLNSKDVEHVDNSPMNVEVKSGSLEEDEEIAKAVARRQRRRLEREDEHRRKHDRDRQQSQSAVLKDSDQFIRDAERHEEASVVPCQTRNSLHSVDPVSEFGFLIKGSEFHQYNRQNKADSGPAWNWIVDERVKNEEDPFRAKTMVGKSSRASGKRPLLSGREEEDPEWGGESKEEQERIAKVMNPERKKKGLTRVTRSNISDYGSKSPRTLTGNRLMQSRKLLENDKDMSDFIVDDDELIKDEEDEKDEEPMDDIETVSCKTEMQKMNRRLQRPMCKYGSSCYRKNEEHLSQFSHPVA